MLVRGTGRLGTRDLANGQRADGSEDRLLAAKQTAAINAEGRVPRIAIIAEQDRRAIANVSRLAASSRAAETRVSAAARRRNGRFESGHKLLWGPLSARIFVDGTAQFVC
jgi:hypothetical protein